MTREEYNELKTRAHKMMLDDYEWMLQQEPDRYLWGHYQCWLIEFVHDVNDIATLKSVVEEEDLCDAWHDNLFRKKPLCQLYEGFFAQVGVAVPNNPAKSLNKLRAMEQRRRIFPDSITLFYMNEIQKNPNCRIIELLIVSKGDDESECEGSLMANSNEA